MKIKKILMVLLAVLMVGCQSQNKIEVTDQTNVSSVESTEESSQESSQESSEDLDLPVYLDEQVVDSSKAMAIIEDLASEKYAGRQAGTSFNYEAEDYLVEVFKEVGLKPLESLGGYKQTYSQLAVIPVKPTEITIDGLDLDYQVDFTERFINGMTYYDKEIEAEMVLIDSSSKLSDDIESLKGKILIVPSSVFYGGDVFGKVQKLHDQGVDVHAIITEGQAAKGGMRVARGAYGAGEFEAWDPVFVQMDKESFQSVADLAKDNAKMTISMDYEVSEVEVSNIVGYIPGKHETGDNEAIILGAHMDHVGNNMNGTFNAGALDNASGVASILELARVINESGQPEDDIIVVAFNGEEDGLLGSAYFAENPPIEYTKDHTKMLNLDMVGSSGIVPLKICSADMSGMNMRKQMVDLAKEMDIDYTSETFGSSDHVNFADEGIPAVMLIHLDYDYYHTFMDTAENAVSQDRLDQVIKLSLKFLNAEAYQ